MTLGKKLSSYRKLAGLTQQQLGERLSLTAQAISKWENDLAEPDLSALRALAELYKVSVDELLDLNATSFDIAGAESNEEEETAAAAAEPAAATIGFCKMCGIVVTEENLGANSPVILCKKCVEAKREADARAEQQRKQAEAQKIQAEKAKREAYKRGLKNGMVWHFVWATLAALAFLGVMIGVMAVNGFSTTMLVVAILGTVLGFMIVFCLFYDCWVEEVIFNWTSKAFQAPGLIFTFDLDGISWLIAMKILFWLIGLLFSLVCSAIGIAIACVIVPFVFPYVIHHIRKSLKTGEPCEVE